MKKTLLFLALTLMLALGARAQEVVIGNGTSMNSSSAFSSNYTDSWWESTYLSSEINVSGSILSLSLHTNGQPFVVEEVNIYMGHRVGENYSGSDFTPMSDLTLVYSGTSVTIGAVDEAMARVQGIEPGTDVVLQTNADGTPAAAIEPEGSTLTGSADEAAIEPGEMSFPEMNPADALGSQEGEQADLPGMEAAGLPGMEASGPVEYDDLPVVDAALVADTTNVIAAALATIMDPVT